MAYENGRRINRYTAKMIGKRKKQNYRKEGRYYWNVLGDKWWSVTYLSGKRTFAKRETSRSIRQTSDQIPSHAGYRKMFDYHHTLW